MKAVSRAALALWIVLSFAAARGNASPRFVGAAECGTCHPAQWEDWKKTPHAASLSRLSKTERADARCRGCHTMAPAERDPALEGVQCEACHGAGRHYAPAYVMKDSILRTLLGLEKIDAKTCASCHRPETPAIEPFDFDARIGLVAHGAERSSP